MNHRTFMSVVGSALLLGFAAVGCAPADPFVTTTDSGVWSIEIAATEYPTGPNEILLSITDEFGQLGVGGELVADVTMPAMGHGSTEVVTVAEVGDGDYTVNAEFQMAGAWAVVGTVSDGEVVEDPFELAIEVLAE